MTFRLVRRHRSRQVPKVVRETGEPSWIRTSDLLIKSQLLYRLSYGPTLGRGLAARAAAGKALGEMTDTKVANSPGRRNGRERLEDEAARSELRMGYAELSRAKLALAPERNIEVQHAWAPAPAATAAESSLQCLETRQHIGRFELALNERDGIREVAARAAVRGIQNDRRSIEQAELCVEPSNCFLDHGRWAAETAVRPV
jgi:hypothetical protein